MSRRVFILSSRKLRLGFNKIIDDDPPMAKEEGFYTYLLRHAGQETNPRHLIIILTLALRTLTTGYPVNLSKHAEAMIDDKTTIKVVRQHLVNIGMRHAEQ